MTGVWRPVGRGLVGFRLRLCGASHSATNPHSRKVLLFFLVFIVLFFFNNRAALFVFLYIYIYIYILKHPGHSIIAITSVSVSFLLTDSAHVENKVTQSRLCL